MAIIFTANHNNLPLGLDISDLSLKLVQLKKTRDKLRLQALSRLDLEPGIIEMGEIKEPNAAAKALRKLLEKPLYGSINSFEVVACLPEAKSFIKLIKVEKSPNELKEIIEPEIEKHIPLQNKEMYYDWQLVARQQISDLVLIGAAPRLVVNQYIEVLKAAKLSVLALEPEPSAICRALLPEEAKKYDGPGDQNYGIIDIGAKRANMTIYAKNTIAMSISMPISSDSATDQIAKTLEIKREEAEKAKIICGLDKSQANGIIAEIMSNMVDKLIGRIRSALDYYDSHFSDQGRISKIILTGGGSNIKDLAGIISQAVKLPVETGDPFVHISEKLDFSKIKQAKAGKDQNKDSQPGQDLSHEAGPGFTTAIGLALRKVFID